MDFAAILAAISSVVALSSASGTALFTNPISTARGAAIISPVNSISIACLWLTLRDKATMGVEQNSPICTPGVPKRAPSSATAKSQVATNWHPAAVATPRTSAITGLGQATIACITDAQSAMILVK